MHSTDALAAGERTARLFGLAARRETPLSSAAEQAALALTDAVTRIGDEGVPDAVWDTARLHFDDNAVLDLVVPATDVVDTVHPRMSLRGECGAV